MNILKNILHLLGIKKSPNKYQYRRVWAIGDIQGCHSAFMRLLDKIDFDPTKDRLWIAGDLVNRGKDSLATLEYLYSIRDSINIVLGNHDITLLAMYWNLKKPNTYLKPILESTNVDLLIDWLRSQPFVHYDETLGYVMVHAGIPPAFDLDMALKFSQKLQCKLQSDNAAKWLNKKMLGGIHSFTDKKKNRFAISAFTRMRFCYDDGRLDFNQKGSPTKKTYNAGLYPWFEISNRKSIKDKIIFGHWSTLGYIENDHVICLDTGCVWQGKMTAKRIDIEDGETIQIECPEGTRVI